MNTAKVPTAELIADAKFLMNELVYLTTPSDQACKFIGELACVAYELGERGYRRSFVDLCMSRVDYANEKFMQTKSSTTEQQHYTMSTKHTPGPWEVSPMNNIYAGKREIAALPAANEEYKANAERIVACVNGCEGIADPSAVKDLLEANTKALEALLWAEAAGLPVHQHIEQARAAISKATGKPV